MSGVSPTTALASSNGPILLTVDVEDWFQVENLRPWNPPATWDSRELRVEANVHRLLDLFDDARTQARRSTHPTDTGPPTLRATFFILGWLAKRLPRLVREISFRGHEIASHGSSHRMCRGLSDRELRNEISGSRRMLEEISGERVTGFRAPNFSVDDRVISILQESGYRYDSSYNNFSLHGRYGKISLNGQHKAGIALKLADDLFELPVSNVNFRNPLRLNTSDGGGKEYGGDGLVLPWGGGAYFRLMPLSLFTMGVRAILNRNGAYIFYMHPWEIDPGQPKVKHVTPGSRFKHYTNLASTEAKLRKLIDRFSGCRFLTCIEYLNEQTLK